MRRIKASMIYKKTKNLRAVQILLGHNKLEGTVRYLGIGVGVDPVSRTPDPYGSRSFDVPPESRQFGTRVESLDSAPLTTS